MTERFDIRKLSFYENGNRFAGSCGSFRYLLQPSEGALTASLWREDVCFEKSDGRTQASFPLTDEGFGQLRAWLEEQSAKGA